MQSALARTLAHFFALMLAAVPVLVVLAPQASLAQRVVILDIEGDAKGKLRRQVETALKNANTVDVVPLKKYVDAAAAKKLKGPAAMTPAGLAKVSRSLKLDAAVTGELGQKFSVRILDSAGQELWTKDLKVSKGLLSADYARKLAKAITAAARTAPQSTEEPAAEAPIAVRPPPPERTEETTPAETSTPVERQPAERQPRTEEQAEEAAAQTPSPDERDQDLEAETKRTAFRPGPKIVSVWAAGTTTWRYYCSRPGVDTCAEFDTLPDPKPQGATVDFTPLVPYAGFNVQLDVFPLARVQKQWAKGFGVLGAFGMGFSLTNVREMGQGTGPSTQVVSTDISWSAQLTYRYYFTFDAHARYPASGYVGVRGGGQGRKFEIDPNAKVALPGANRVYGLVGIDVAIPIIKFFSLEASGSYLINPNPGVDEIAGYGDLSDPTGGGRGTGFSVEGGFAGELFGPLGYRIHVRYTPYADRFYGVGGKWTATDKGAAFESYTSLVWGITGSF